MNQKVTLVYRYQTLQDRHPGLIKNNFFLSQKYDKSFLKPVLTTMSYQGYYLALA